MVGDCVVGDCVVGDCVVGDCVKYTTQTGGLLNTTSVKVCMLQKWNFS